MERKISDNIIVGRNPVKEALKAGRVVQLFLQTGFNFKDILDLIGKVPVTYLPLAELDKRCLGAAHQGAIAVVKPFTYVGIEEIIHKSKSESHPIIVILDGINDPQNMGAIMRSCDVFGVSGIIVPKHNQVPLNMTVAKTSAGAINYVPVALCSNVNQAIRELKENGFWVVSSDGSATMSYSELKYDFPTALIVGSEGKGVSRLVLENSDYVVKIPQYGHVNSLNASVAAGILLSRIKG